MVHCFGMAQDFVYELNCEELLCNGGFLYPCRGPGEGGDIAVRVQWDTPP